MSNAASPQPDTSPAATSTEGGDLNLSELIGDGTLISFGIPLEDRQAKRFTVRVFVLAVAIGALSLVHFITPLGI